MKCRRKIIELDAWQHHADIGTETVVIPGWIMAAITDGRITTVSLTGGYTTVVKTPSGNIMIEDGDWIFLGGFDMLYVVKKDDFSKNYELIE
jgi:hypothetical protein